MKTSKLAELLPKDLQPALSAAVDASDDDAIDELVFALVDLTTGGHLGRANRNDLRRLKAGLEQILTAF